MCPPRSDNKETSLKFINTTLPINLALNVNNDQVRDSGNSSDFHINDHHLIDHYLDSLQNRNTSSMNNNPTAIDKPTNTFFGIEMPLDVYSAIYAGTVLAGGVIGYAKAGSKPSLIAGITFGSLLGIGTYMTSVNINNYHLTLGTSAVLAGVMAKRSISSGKFMPAGLISALSTAMVLRCAYRFWLNEEQSK